MSHSPSPSRRARRTVAAGRPSALFLVPLVLVLGACAGGGGGAADTGAVTPGALSSTGATPSPTPDAAPTDEADQTGEAGEDDQTGEDDVTLEDPDDVEEPEVWATFTAEPGPVLGDVSEAFADDSRLQAVLAFNEEFARAVTANDPRSADWLATLDEGSYDALMDYLGDEFGQTYPGPLPFAPLDIGPGPEDGTASVQGCIISSGFALGSDGVTGAVVTSIEYALVQDPAEPDAWRVQAMWAGAYDCSTTDVPARLW